MTNLMFDGFELGDGNLVYQPGAALSFVTGVNTRFNSGSAMRVAAIAAYFNITASAEIYMGCAVNTLANLDTNLRPLFHFFGDGGTITHVVVGMKQNAVEARLVSTAGTLLASGAGAFMSNAWYYIEIYVKVADSGGRVKVVIDGVTLIDFTGDTRNGGTSTNIDRVVFQANGVNCDIDDLYINNGLGSVNNGLLGDKRVHTLPVMSGGASTQMTPTGSGSNWVNIDETPYSTTDYNQGASGQKDTYGITDLPATATAISAVQVRSVMKKTDAGVMQARNVVRSASTDYAGTTRSLGASDGTYIDIWETDPATSAAWTVAGVNGVQAGVEAL